VSAGELQECHQRLKQEGPASRRAFQAVHTNGSGHQVTVTSFEHVAVLASHTWYVALLTVFDGLSV